jgi:hypothetical protein
MEVVTKSKIKGAFRGWTGRGIYQLANRQKWKQVEYLYEYRYMYRPEAEILKDGLRYYLRIEGMKDAIQVRRFYGDIEEEA